MSLESDFYGVLASAGVVALVGDRITPAHDDDPAAASPPYVVYQTVFSAPEYDLDGATSLTRARMQVDCYATGFDSAHAIAAAVVAAVPVSGWPIHRTGHQIRDLGLDTETRLYRRMVEFSVFHRSS